MKLRLIWVGMMLLTAVSCGLDFPLVRGETAPASPPTSMPTAFPPPPTPVIIPTAIPTPVPTAVPAAEIHLLWVDPGFNGRLTLPQTITLTHQVDQADTWLEVGGSAPVSRWVYALVAPFPEIREGVSAADLGARWQGEPGNLLTAVPLMVSPATYSAFAGFWGAPADGVIQIIPGETLVEQAWASRPSLAIIPFEELSPRWKVLAVDGRSPITHDFDLSSYPLTVPFSLRGDTGESELAISPTNYDPNKLTTLVMTGVTALVRATAWTMEQQGVLYPAQDIGDLLRQADITHISNEVPFAEGCPYPDPGQEGVVFCSRPTYIALLEDIGTDVVELTGDHFHDWGPEAMLYTLELYKERGWLTYGGGANLEEGRQPILLEHNGNRFAFIGCNGKGGGFAQAGPNNPGSVSCDIAWMSQQIAELTAQGVLVIATFQHAEYYVTAAPPALFTDFRAMAEAGAVVVSGSQAHQPHSLEFWGDGLIHYGLGNLFFDQYSISAETRQAFIDRHVFYNGRYISTQLIPIQFVDFARSRPMTEAERDPFLRQIFQASGW